MPSCGRPTASPKPALAAPQDRGRLPEGDTLRVDLLPAGAVANPNDRVPSALEPRGVDLDVVAVVVELDEHQRIGASTHSLTHFSPFQTHLQYGRVRLISLIFSRCSGVNGSAL
jgi:hypothetical protein